MHMAIAKCRRGWMRALKQAVHRAVCCRQAKMRVRDYVLQESWDRTLQASNNASKTQL